MTSLVLGRRAADELPEDAMKLRVAAEACFEGGFKKCGALAGFALRVISLQKVPHALPIAKFNDRKPRLLFEETAEAGGA